MSNVIKFTGVTKLDLPVAQVLDGAKLANMEHIVILGYDSDGMEYFVSTYADGGDMLWLLERAKLQLLRQCDGDSE